MIEQIIKYFPGAASIVINGKVMGIPFMRIDVWGDGSKTLTCGLEMEGAEMYEYAKHYMDWKDFEHEYF